MNVKDLVVCIPVSNDTSLLRLNHYFYRKYWGNIRLAYIGYSESLGEFCTNLHSNVERVSTNSFFDLGEPLFDTNSRAFFVGTCQKDVSNWANDLARFFNNVSDEFCIFALDDFIPTKRTNYEFMQIGFSEMLYNKRVFRLALNKEIQKKNFYCFMKHFQIYDNPALQTDFYTNLSVNTFFSIDTVSLVKAEPTIPYKVSTQTSIWRTEYLYEFLNRKEINTPWDFEIIGTGLACCKNIYLLGFYSKKFKNYPAHWVTMGMLSRNFEGLYNVLGMCEEDVKILMSNKNLRKDQICFAEHTKGYFPILPDFGNDFEDVTIKKLQKYLKSVTNLQEYEDIYG